jgi:hypothetical protein
MAPQNQSLNLRYLSYTSLALGILGGVFYWWAPLGFVLSLSGLILGLVDWTRARKQSLSHRLSLFAMAISLATLILAIAIMALGLQTITFGGG